MVKRLDICIVKNLTGIQIFLIVVGDFLLEMKTRNTPTIPTI